MADFLFNQYDDVEIPLEKRYCTIFTYDSNLTGNVKQKAKQMCEVI
jgi:hypothetical protein